MSGRCQAPPLSDVLRSSFFVLRSSFFVLRSSFFVLRSSFFVLRSSFFVLRSSFFVLRSQRRPSNPPAAEAGPPPKSGAGVGGRRMSVNACGWAARPSRHPGSQRPSAALLSPHAGLGQAWVRDPALVFYPGSRGSRGPQRLFSLTPDTNAATPSPWRSLAWSGPTHYRAQRA